MQLTIRCALQSFSDYNVDIELGWTVLQLKQHLARTLDFKPEIEHQRLIYAGRYLENGQKISEILKMINVSRTTDEPMEKQVIHMVYNNGKQGSMTTSKDSEGVRRRANAGNVGRSSQNLPQSNIQNMPQPIMGMPYMMDASAQQNHEAWLAAYQNYVAQMMQFYQNAGPFSNGMQMQYGLWNGTQNQYVAFSQLPTNQQQLYGVPFTGQPPLQHVPAQQLLNAQQNPLQNQQPQMPFANAQPNNLQIDAEIQMPDFIDLVYKSIRIALLAMVVYLYSSLERFFFVLCIVGIFWFVHARRGQQNRRDQNEAAAERVQEREQLPIQPNQNNEMVAQPATENNNSPVGNNDSATVAPAAVPNAPQASNVDAAPVPAAAINTTAASTINAWSVFWTTIQSFFTSLIPDNPAPLDVN